MRYAIKIAYDGKDFHGFARQPNVKTVEGKIIEVLREERFIKDARSSKFRYASRTDKGVSALGNVIAFDSLREINLDDLRGLNEKIEGEIYFYGLKGVEDNFYPRYAKMRSYRYYLKIDLDREEFERFLKVANLFTGIHNFSNFARIERNKNPIRKMENIIINWINDVISVDFYAKTFLWQQVRRMISAMYTVAIGRAGINEVESALKNPDERRFFGIAPPENLILVDVMFDFDFEIDKKIGRKVSGIEKKIIRRAMTDSLDRRRFSCQ